MTLNTNDKKHSCDKMPMGCYIEYKYKNSNSNSGFELFMTHKLKKDRLVPEHIEIGYGIDYCPFCGEKLIKTKHDMKCKCNMCNCDELISASKNKVYNNFVNTFIKNHGKPPTPEQIPNDLKILMKDETHTNTT